MYNRQRLYNFFIGVIWVLVGICDDIKEYRNSIKCYTIEYFKLQKMQVEIDEFSNGEELLKENKNYDILFIDIELGGINGIDLTKEIQKKHKKTIIIIVTSYIKYLDDAMDVNVLRYIDKPITQERIFSALDKSINKINNNTIIVQTIDNQLITLEKSEIIYVEAKLRRTEMVTTNNLYYLKNNITDLKNKLNASFFACPHNSFIINMNFIKSFNRNQIILKTIDKDVSVSVATRKQADFKKKYISFIGEDY